MSFGAPVMLLGALAAVVPVIIHLIGRQRAPKRPFAAIDFVLRSNRALARRVRLRQFLVLAVRVLLVAGAALMMAKPFGETESDLPALVGGVRSAVLVIDDTASMRWKRDGKSLLERAKRRARTLVGLHAGHGSFAVLRVSDPSGPLGRTTRDVRKIRRAIAAVKPTYRHADLTPALAQARSIVGDAPPADRHVFVLSDMARHGGIETTIGQTRQIQLHLIDVARDLPRGNRAVVDLSAAASADPGQRSTRFNARLCNFSEEAAELRVALEVDGRKVARGELEVGAWSCGSKPFHHAFRRGGVHEAVVSIAADALNADDRRYLEFEVQNELRVLLINGEPSPIRHRDELFYLETALHAAVGGRRISLTTVTIDDLERARFDAHDVVVACNVRAIPVNGARQLERFVKRGGGLLLSVGDQVQPAAFNTSLEPLLPQPLRGVSSSLVAASDRPALQLGQVEADHPIIAGIWSEQTGAGLRSARFERTYRLRPDPTGKRRVVLRFDDGSPALIERQVDAGRVLLFASSLDRDWNDLAIRPGYLPLVQQMVRYLGRAAQRALGPTVLVGATRAISVRPGWQQLRVVGPGGQERIWAADALRGRASVDVQVDEPGFYHLSAASEEGGERQLPRASFAANVDSAESDLRQGKTPAPVDRPGTVRATRRVELWHALGFALVLLVLLESFLTRR